MSSALPQHTIRDDDVSKDEYELALEEGVDDETLLRRFRGEKILYQ